MTTTPADAEAGPYGLRYPTLDDARAALERVHHASVERLWSALLKRAGLSGREAAPDAVKRLVDAMLTADPVTHLTGRSLMIRMISYERLSAAQESIEGAR